MKLLAIALQIILLVSATVSAGLEANANGVGGELNILTKKETGPSDLGEKLKTVVGDLASVVTEMFQWVGDGFHDIVAGATHFITSGSESPICEPLEVEGAVPDDVDCKCGNLIRAVKTICKTKNLTFAYDGQEYAGSTFTSATATQDTLSGAKSFKVTSCYQHMDSNYLYKRGVELIETIADASISVEGERCLKMEICSGATFDMDCSNINLAKTGDAKSVSLPSSNGTCVSLDTLSAVNNNGFGEIVYRGTFNPFLVSPWP